MNSHDQKIHLKTNAGEQEIYDYLRKTGVDEETARKMAGMEKKEHGQENLPHMSSSLERVEFVTKLEKEGFKREDSERIADYLDSQLLKLKNHEKSSYMRTSRFIRNGIAVIILLAILWFIWPK